MTTMWGYRLQHLDRLSTDRGIFEHAKGTRPRVGHGYCTDDNARLLVVTGREPDEGIAARLSRIALTFVLNAQEDDGLVHNRLVRGADGRWAWTDTASSDDCWGRAVWGLGTAAAAHPHPGVRAAAQWGFMKSATRRSEWRRPMAFAALGAADLLGVEPRNAAARALLEDAIAGILPTGRTDRPWPEDRLTYANASLAEALIAAGMALQRPDVMNRGLAMLSWLVDVQTRDGHLSVVGTAGRSLDEHGVQFDQQPIEVGALADACWRAWSLTGDPRWADALDTAAAWFAGENDVGVRMVDDESGGGYDGLTRRGRNLNQGAESTLALISTMQRASRLPRWRFDPYARSGTVAEEPAR